MQIGNVTTPFGRRLMTLALIKGQLRTSEIKAGKSVEKWKVFRDICEAKVFFNLQDRSLAVLNALLSFYPDTMLSEEQGLVVFPSNAQLSLRAHGIAGTTLRRQLAVLVDAGLVQRRDSPNGKRYAHRTRTGEIEQAFGFDLAPLLARSEEFAHLAQQVAEEKKLFKRAKEALTLCRRDIRKLISAAMEEGADGDWETVEADYIALVGALVRTPSRSDVENTLGKLLKLREDVVKRLEIQLKTEKMDGNDNRDGYHIQNSNTESIHEFEPSSRQKQRDKLNHEPLKTFPLGMVMKACPDIAGYGPGGAITSWRDLMSAAVVVRSMLGVSPSAYQAACEVMGPQNAAISMACLLEKAGHINSAGGYLRDLTRKTALGEFSLGPMLMALLRANVEPEKQRA